MMMLILPFCWLIETRLSWRESKIVEFDLNQQQGVVDVAIERQTQHLVLCLR